MKASVQYNDIVGSAAADVADWYNNSLQFFLQKTYESYDGDRYSCRGCTAYLGSGNTVYVHFICLDKETGNFLRFSPSDSWPLEQFFSMFKRLEIVMGKDINEVEISDDCEEISLK